MNLWRKYDPNVILLHGNQQYKCLKRTDYLSANDLPYNDFSYSVHRDSVKAES